MPQGYNSVTVGSSRVNGLVTDPVTMVYHELRSPLALMATAARMAADDCGSDELRARCLSIVRTAERMLRTAGQVMVCAEAARDDVPSRFAPVELIERVVHDYRGMGVAIELDLRGRARSFVYGAPGQMEALLCSVVGNALDHGNPDLPVTISVTEGAHELIIEVRNQVGSARSHRGLGLGTYIGDRLAQALDASIDFARTDEAFTARITVPTCSRELAFAG